MKSSFKDDKLHGRVIIWLENNQLAEYEDYEQVYEL